MLLNPKKLPQNSCNVNEIVCLLIISNYKDVTTELFQQDCTISQEISWEGKICCLNPKKKVPKKLYFHVNFVMRI